MKLAYSPPEVAALISLPLSTIYDLIERGELQAKRVGRRWIVAHAEVERFLSGSKDFQAPPEFLALFRDNLQ